MVMAGVLVASGFLLVRPPTPPWRTPGGRSGRRPTRSPIRWLPARLPPGRPQQLVVALLALLLATAVVGAGLLDPLPALGGALLAAGLAGRSLAARARESADRLADAAAEAIALLAADVSVGRGLREALQGVTDDLTGDPHAEPARRRLGLLLVPVVDGARLGADVPDALREVAATPGCAAFARVAAAWDLAETVGMPAAAVLGRVALAVRGHAEQVRAVRAELAGARASARLLAALPAVGLLMGIGLGARPLHVLLETTYGNLALCSGIVLELLGLAWTDRIARRAEAA
jgi:tight adherence protein B